MPPKPQHGIEGLYPDNQSPVAPADGRTTGAEDNPPLRQPVRQPGALWQEQSVVAATTPEHASGSGYRDRSQLTPYELLSLDYLHYIPADRSGLAPDDKAQIGRQIIQKVMARRKAGEMPDDQIEIFDGLVIPYVQYWTTNGLRGKWNSLSSNRGGYHVTDGWTNAEGIFDEHAAMVAMVDQLADTRDDDEHASHIYETPPNPPAVSPAVPEATDAEPRGRTRDRFKGWFTDSGVGFTLVEWGKNAAYAFHEIGESYSLQRERTPYDPVTEGTLGYMGRSIAYMFGKIGLLEATELVVPADGHIEVEVVNGADGVQRRHVILHSGPWEGPYGDYGHLSKMTEGVVTPGERMLPIGPSGDSNGDYEQSWRARAEWARDRGLGWGVITEVADTHNDIILNATGGLIRRSMGSTEFRELTITWLESMTEEEYQVLDEKLRLIFPFERRENWRMFGDDYERNFEPIEQEMARLAAIDHIGGRFAPMSALVRERMEMLGFSKMSAANAQPADNLQVQEHNVLAGLREVASRQFGIQFDGINGVAHTLLGKIGFPGKVPTRDPKLPELLPKERKERQKK